MLALTKKTGYGLVAMTHLAGLAEHEVSSAREIASTFGVPTSLLMNVLKELAASGYVESVRGARGGYRLAMPAEAITLADLIAVLEGPMRLAECITGEAEAGDKSICRVMDRCPIVDPVLRIHRKLTDFLRNVTLAQLAEPAAALRKQ